MYTPIEKKDNWMLFECQSVSQARDILAENNIAFDCLYVYVSPRRNRVTGLVERVDSGIHIYFNLGKDVNVAYFTPGMERLGIINRPDGTPEEKRRYVFATKEAPCPDK